LRGKTIKARQAVKTVAAIITKYNAFFGTLPATDAFFVASSSKISKKRYRNDVIMSLRFR